jgi:hypothetical protein
MTTTNFDKLFASSPVNLTAAKVVSKGINWKPDRKIVYDWMVRSETVLAVVKFSGPMDQDLTGERFGRFVVRGKSADIKTNSKGAAWVCRCDCGASEIRRTSSLKRMAIARSMCSHCDYLEQMKLGRVPSLHEVKA